MASASADQTVKIWDPADGELPCKGMIISGATGITAAQRLTLVQLGAIQADP